MIIISMLVFGVFLYWKTFFSYERAFVAWTRLRFSVIKIMTRHDREKISKGKKVWLLLYPLFYQLFILISIEEISMLTGFVKSSQLIEIKKAPTRFMSLTGDNPGLVIKYWFSIFLRSPGKLKDSRDSNLVDSASSIRLSQRLSHACLSINKSIRETANGSLYQL